MGYDRLDKVECILVDLGFIPRSKAFKKYYPQVEQLVQAGYTDKSVRCKMEELITFRARRAAERTQGIEHPNPCACELCK